MKRLSILMPVYNELKTVDDAIEATLAATLPVPFELVVVDDGSTDGTLEKLQEWSLDRRVRVYAHERNQGKGAAIRTALKYAEGDACAILDADLEYDPNDLALLLPPLVSGEANVVYGVRAFDGFSSHSYLYVLGNRAVTFAANVIYNVYLGDLMTCHKVIRTDLFRSLPLRARGFEVEAEITARLLNSGERIYELPVRYKARSFEEGKKLRTTDGLRVISTLLRCRLREGKAAALPAHAAVETRGGARRVDTHEGRSRGRTPRSEGSSRPI